MKVEESYYSCPMAVNPTLKIRDSIIFIGIDKSSFLISPQKQMLLVLVRSASDEYHNICFCREIR